MIRYSAVGDISLIEPLATTLTTSGAVLGILWWHVNRIEAKLAAVERKIEGRFADMQKEISDLKAGQAKLDGQHGMLLHLVRNSKSQ